MCLSLHDYHYTASRYKKGFTYLKNRVTTNQKHIIDPQKPKRREHKYNTKEIHQTTNRKTKRKRKGQIRNIKSMGKQGLKWQ